MAQPPLPPERRKIHVELVEPDLTSLDAAIDAMTDSSSPEDALTALAKATAGINSCFDIPPRSLDQYSSVASFAYSSMSAFGYQSTSLQSARTQLIGLLESRLQRYFAAVKLLVDKFGPKEYQITVGFPATISIALTWKVDNTPTLPPMSPS